jgi:putative inorganic carbon (HCO3(-)) transporter
MKNSSAHLAPAPSGIPELPLVLLFSLCLAGAAVATFSLPLRFALACSAGMALLAMSCFVENKRMFYITLMTLTLILPMNKRLMETQSPWPTHAIDAIIIDLTDVFLMLSGVVWFFYSIRSGQPRRAFRKTLIAPFLALCVACLFSFINSAEPSRSVFELIRMVKTLALYWFLIYNLRDFKEARWVIGCLAVGILIEFGFCMVEKYVFHGTLGLKYFGEAAESMNSFVDSRIVFRSGGTMGHPNNLAHYLDLLLPLMLTRFFAVRSSTWTRWFYALVLAAGCGCLYFTQSRGGIAATGLSLTLCFLVLAWRNLRLRIFPILTLTFVLAAVAVLAVGHRQIFERFGKRDAGAFQTRLDQYHVALRIIHAHPVVGLGLNTYIPSSPAYDNTADKVSFEFTEPVHNIWLLSMAETGIIGLASLVFLIFSFLRLARFWRWPYGDVYDLHLGIFFSVVGYLIHANGEPEVIGTSEGLFFLLALLTVVHQFGMNHYAMRKAAA